MSLFSRRREQRGATDHGDDEARPPETTETAAWLTAERMHSFDGLETLTTPWSAHDLTISRQSLTLEPLGHEQVTGVGGLIHGLVQVPSSTAALSGHTLPTARPARHGILRRRDRQRGGRCSG